LGDGGFHISGPKQIRGRHQGSRTGAGTIGTALVVDATVHADAAG
jgi:hypothetical protein